MVARTSRLLSEALDRELSQSEKAELWTESRQNVSTVALWNLLHSIRLITTSWDTPMSGKPMPLDVKQKLRAKVLRALEETDGR